MITRYSSLLLLFGLLFLGCRIPVQLPRVTITENFTQSFVFSSTDRTKTIEKLMHTKGDKLTNLLLNPDEANVMAAHLDSSYFISKGKLQSWTFSLVPDKRAEEFLHQWNRLL